jgi:hypothetical protein
MRARIASRILILACAVAVPSAGCGMIIGVSSWQDVNCVEDCGVVDSSVPVEAASDSSADALPAADADAGLDATPDTSTPDAAGDSSTGPPDASNPYHPVDDVSQWTKFDVSTITTGLQGFAGGTFDGRYVYLSPHNDGAPDGLVARLDTQAPTGFANAASWASFATSSLAAGAIGYLGAVYDPIHKNVYLVPNGAGTPQGVVVSYPSGPSFGADAGWATFSTLTLDAGAGAAGFAGATFDGTYLYLVPSNNGAPDGIVAQLDTTQPFTSSTSWSTFDMTQLPGAAMAKGYFGAAYTGSQVVFVPAGGSSPSPLVASYLTSQPFSNSAAWQTYDLSGLNNNARGFRGTAFDGQYVYLVPNNNGSPDGVVARYDSTQSFTNQSAWTFFDVTQINAAAKGFAGGAFDGRYVYLVPNAGTVLLRYDTTAAFGTAGSWSTFDLQAQLGSGLGPFEGAVFDGEFLYLVPSQDGLVARFDARSPAALPPGQSGSFL